MKRIFSALLALLLVATLIPVQTMAAGEHRVNVQVIGNGTASTNYEMAAPNQIVKITANATPGSGHELKETIVRYEDGTEIYVDYYDMTFTMPACEVTVIVKFGTIGDGEDDSGAAVAYVYCTASGIPLGSGVDANVNPGDRYQFVALDGYTIDRVEATDGASGLPIAADTNHSVIVPASGVNAIIWLRQGSAGSGTSTEYNITRGTISNGSVLFSAETAGANTLVTITPEAHTGYVLNALTVTDSNGKPVDITLKDGKYEFRMPAGDVQVDAYFVPAVTVTFHHNDEGNKTSPVSVPQGGTLTALPVPTRTGYLFLGWYTADNTEVSAGTKFDQSTDVYARWIKMAHTTDPDSNKFRANIDLSDEEILNRFVTDQERASGKDITVRLVVDPLSEGSIPAADKTAIENMAGEATVAAYLDIRLLKKIGDAQEVTIPDTRPHTVPITMTVEPGVLPASAGSVQIIYYHDGEAKTLDATYNAGRRFLTFDAYEFSTYALAYTTGGAGAGTAEGTLDNVPKTGEASGLGGWILMALCCTAMLACVSIYDKKRAG